MLRAAFLCGVLALSLGACRLARPRVVCVGDCDGDGAITAADFVRLTGIDLGKVPFDACKALDANGDGQFSADERIVMVRNYSDGCQNRAADGSE